MNSLPSIDSLLRQYAPSGPSSTPPSYQVSRQDRYSSPPWPTIPSESPTPPPQGVVDQVDDRANDREILVTPQRKLRISMKDEDTKALLVKLCMNNFDDYQQTKKKNVFMDQMQMMFKEQTGLEVSVKGYMYRWVKDRRKIVEEEKTKSGVARSYGEVDQVLDQWIAMVDDVTAITEDEKKAKKEEENQRMKEIAKVRDAMRTTYSERRAEGLSAEGTEEDKKCKGTDSRYCPAESKKRITDRIMYGMKEDGQQLIAAVKVIEDKKMDWLEEILVRVLGVQSVPQVLPADTSLVNRVDAIEKNVASMKGTLEQLVSLLERNRS